MRRRRSITAAAASWGTPALELKQLRSFVAVAEELHFSRAAARLHLAQSALSAQIRRLEEEFGGPLLLRSTRQVRLTPAGELLLPEARAILAAADGTHARVRSLARGEAASLSIASLGPVPGSLLSPLLSTFSARRPRVRIDVRALEFAEMLSALRTGRADVAFLYAPIAEADLDVTPLLCEPRVAVLPAGHRLAAAPSVGVHDLAGEVFVSQPDSTPQAWRDFWMLVPETGSRPAISPYVGENIEEWLHLIGRGEGVDTCPAIIARYFARPDVVFVPVADAAPATLVLAVGHLAREPMVDEFIALAVEIAAKATAIPGSGYGLPPGSAPALSRPRPFRQRGEGEQLTAGHQQITGADERPESTPARHHELHQQAGARAVGDEQVGHHRPGDLARVVHAGSGLQNLTDGDATEDPGERFTRDRVGQTEGTPGGAVAEVVDPVI
jgi:DNA-binding transcriptional LysR family regulator